MVWKPNVTVAAIVERNGQFLFVEEEALGRLVLNQPAGHLEAGESLAAAAIRETLEESAYHFEPAGLVGIYRWPRLERGVTYLRFAFFGSVTGIDTGRTLDKGIVRALWLTPEELALRADQHRSPQVALGVQHYLEGRRFPLDLLQDVQG